jgi:hypothetical protein
VCVSSRKLYGKQHTCIENGASEHCACNWDWGSFPEVKWRGSEVDLSPPSSAEVKNELSCTSSSPVCLHAMDRNNFLFENYTRYLTGVPEVSFYYLVKTFFSVGYRPIQRVPWALLSGDMIEAYF